MLSENITEFIPGSTMVYVYIYTHHAQIGVCVMTNLSVHSIQNMSKPDIDSSKTYLYITSLY